MSNLPVLAKFLTDLAIGAIIRNAGDATAQVAKANEVIAVAKALDQINSGDTTAGLLALENAVVAAPGSDPAKNAATETAIAWLAQKAAALQGVVGGTILGAANTALLEAVNAEAIAIATKYLPAPAAAK